MDDWRHRDGDVAPRVSLRFDEVLESLRLIREICCRLPESVDDTEFAGSLAQCLRDEGMR